MSILRQLTTHVEDDVSPKGLALFGHSLREAALRVRRAGLEHLIPVASSVEVDALAWAGEQLAKERVALLVMALHCPAQAVADLDGGTALRRQVLRSALGASKGASNG